MIGPNRYLVEMLRCSPGLAGRALVVCDRDRGGGAELEALGCRTATWPEIALLRVGLGLGRLPALASRHTFGLRRLVLRLRALEPELVVSNTENLWLGGLACRWLRLPHVQVFHAMTVFDRLQSRRRLLVFYLRYLSFFCDRLVAVSEAQASALREHGVPGTKVAAVPNPIPVAELIRRAGLEAPEIDQVAGARQPLVVCAGRLGPKKGQDLLVEALPAVVREHPDLLCCFFGRPESETGSAFERRLAERVDARGLRQHVLFLGETLDLPAWLRRADLYVQPSRTESFGRVVAEALICGTPVVAVATGGLPEVAGPGGKLVAPEDARGLGEAILATLAGSAEEIREVVRRGRRHVEQSFDAPRVAALFEATLESAVPLSEPGAV